MEVVLEAGAEGRAMLCHTQTLRNRVKIRFEVSNEFRVASCKKPNNMAYRTKCSLVNDTRIEQYTRTKSKILRTKYAVPVMKYVRFKIILFFVLTETRVFRLSVSGRGSRVTRFATEHKGRRETRSTSNASCHTHTLSHGTHSKPHVAILDLQA